MGRTGNGSNFENVREKLKNWTFIFSCIYIYTRTIILAKNDIKKLFLKIHGSIGINFHKKIIGGDLQKWISKNFARWFRWKYPFWTFSNTFRQKIDLGIIPNFSAKIQNFQISSGPHSRENGRRERHDPNFSIRKDWIFKLFYHFCHFLNISTFQNRFCPKIVFIRNFQTR